MIFVLINNPRTISLDIITADQQTKAEEQSHIPVTRQIEKAKEEAAILAKEAFYEH